MLHVFSRSTLDMPEVKHPIYPGSSSGDLIGPINLERFQDRSWQVTEEEKRKMLGGFRIAVGGLSGDASESTKRTQFKRSELKRKPAGTADDNVLYEPFCYHGLPPEYYVDSLPDLVDLNFGALILCLFEFLRFPFSLPKSYFSRGFKSGQGHVGCLEPASYH